MKNNFLNNNEDANAANGSTQFCNPSCRQQLQVEQLRNGTTIQIMPPS
ncbi:hypothetical protein DOY81_007091 [Sarcophaga bullata]|nr:hypothetical protein DOY81_007091 [Sarcophaga bullata]